MRITLVIGAACALALPATAAAQSMHQMSPHYRAPMHRMMPMHRNYMPVYRQSYRAMYRSSYVMRQPYMYGYGGYGYGYGGMYRQAYMPYAPMAYSTPVYYGYQMAYQPVYQPVYQMPVYQVQVYQPVMVYQAPAYQPVYMMMRY